MLNFRLNIKIILKEKNIAGTNYIFNVNRQILSNDSHSLQIYSTALISLNHEIENTMLIFQSTLLIIDNEVSEIRTGPSISEVSAPVNHYVITCVCVCVW